MYKKVLTLTAVLIAAPCVQAQSNTGVSGPVIKDGYRSFEYRIAYDPEGISNDESGYKQRFNYRQSINSEWGWRVVSEFKKTATSNTDFDYIQGELFWQMTDTQSYKNALRFDLRHRDGDRPNQVGINWLNQHDFGDNWQARWQVSGAIQFGDNRKNGISLSSAAYMSKKLEVGRLGVELYSSYGTTSDFKSLSDQSHTVGPFLSNKIGKTGWSYFVGALFGLTDASDDKQLRLRVAKSF